MTTKAQTIIETPDAKPIHEGFALVLREAQALEVKDKTSLDRAGEVLLDLKRAVKVLTDGNGNDWEGFDRPCKSANDAHKFLTKLRAMALTPYEQAISAVNRRMTVYEMEAERKAKEEEARLQALARQQEEERLLAEAIAAEAEGEKEVAEEILAQPVQTVQVEVKPEIAEAKGLSGHTNYKAELVDLLTLVRWVAEHPNDLNYLEANMPAINGLARSQREGFKLAGCKLVKDKVRTRRT